MSDKIRQSDELAATLENIIRDNNSDLLDSVTIAPTLVFFIKSKNTSIIGKLISRWTKSECYHVELIFDNIRYTSDFTKGVIYSREGPDIDASVIYKQLKPISVSKLKIFTFREWLTSTLGAGYDIINILFAHVLPFNMESRYKWTCSEHATVMLSRLGYCLDDLGDAHNVTPGDLYNKYIKD